MPQEPISVKNSKSSNSPTFSFNILSIWPFHLWLQAEVGRAVLDCLVEEWPRKEGKGYTFHYQLLESDHGGRAPGQSGFQSGRCCFNEILSHRVLYRVSTLMQPIAGRGMLVLYLFNPPDFCYLSITTPTHFPKLTLKTFRLSMYLRRVLERFFIFFFWGGGGTFGKRCWQKGDNCRKWSSCDSQMACSFSSAYVFFCLVKESIPICLQHTEKVWCFQMFRVWMGFSSVCMLVS